MQNEKDGDTYIIYLEQGEKNKAKDLLKKVIFSDDPTYSI